jgi:hypothetical protein
MVIPWPIGSKIRRLQDLITSAGGSFDLNEPPTTMYRSGAVLDSRSLFPSAIILS